MPANVLATGKCGLKRRADPSDLMDMGAAKDLAPIPPAFGSDNSRRSGRVRVQLIRCTLGDVLDISASGMKIRCKGKIPEIGDLRQVRVEGLVMPVEVSARVVWVRKLGWRKNEVGLSFEDLTPEARSELAAIARTAPLNESICRLSDPRRPAQRMAG